MDFAARIGGTDMRRFLLLLLLVPGVGSLLTAVLALGWFREPAADFDKRTLPTVHKEEGEPDDIFLEDPRALALAVGSWVMKAPLPLPDDKKMEELAKTNPVAFLKYCLRRYDQTVQGYECTLKKQERIGGKLHDPETIAVKFRDEPFSVYFEWHKGERQAKKVLYVRGENNNMLLVKPAGVLSIAGVQKRDPVGDDAKKGGRYPLTEFGIKIGTLRTLAAWEEARKNKALHVEYLGLQKIPEAGDRVCYVLKRTRYAKPEEDGVSELKTYFDKETWLQVGSTLKNTDGDVIGDYWFRDLKLNPEFKPDTFKEKSLK
jgi:hypothetical protein